MTQADQKTQLLSARITGQGSMSSTSVIRDIQCLVPPSECVCPAVIGAEMHRHVRARCKTLNGLCHPDFVNIFSNLCKLDLNFSCSYRKRF